MVRALALSAPLPGIELFAEVIPVDWAQARTVARKAIARVKPHAVLHFGVSRRVTGFEVETRAINMSGQSLIRRAPRGPAVRFRVPACRFYIRCYHPPRFCGRSGWPEFMQQLSRNAGRYLCNALYYWSLADADASGALVSFIHMPAIGIEAHAKSCLTFEDAVAGAQVLFAPALRLWYARSEALSARTGGAEAMDRRYFMGLGESCAGRRECR